MQAGDRARRTSQVIGARLGRRERDHRTMQAILHLRSDQADHTGVPIRIKQAGRHRTLPGGIEHHPRQRLFGVIGHRLLHRTPLGVDLLQRLRDVAGLPRIFGEQQRDTQRHVFQPTGRIQARAEPEADIGSGQACGVAATGLDQRLQADAALAVAQPTQTRTDQGAVVGIQRNEVGHGAHRHQIQQRGQVRPLAIGKYTRFAHPSAQRHQHVEDHADAGQRLAGEGVAVQIGVDDDIGRWQLRTGQMVIGHQYLPAPRFGCSHAGMAGNAVIDGDQQIRLQRSQLVHQRR
ncbi:hypothetical protein D3C81_807460 [compost metagenome]